MARPLGWRDSEDLGILLMEAYPGKNPLTVRFTDLHAMVLKLDGFAGAPMDSSEGILEAIQMAWLEEWNDEHGN